MEVVSMEPLFFDWIIVATFVIFILAGLMFQESPTQNIVIVICATVVLAVFGQWLYHHYPMTYFDEAFFREYFANNDNVVGTILVMGFLGFPQVAIPGYLVGIWVKSKVSDFLGFSEQTPIYRRRRTA